MKLQPRLLETLLVPLALLAVSSRAHAEETHFPPPPMQIPVEGAPPPVPTVWMHLNVERAVTLEILSPEETRWRPVCTAPCDQQVPLLGIYRVVDRGMVPSGPTELEARPGDRLTMDVRVRTWKQHETGSKLTIASYIAAAVGLGLEIGALSIDSSSNAQAPLAWGGVGAAGVAIGCTIAGWILLESSNLTQSSLEPASGHAQSFVRRPVWTEEESAKWLPKTMLAAPLVLARF